MRELNAMPMHWYVVKVRQGREQSIARAIAWRFSRQNLADQFAQLFALDKYPGYLFIKMHLTDEAKRLLQETQDVVGLPVPLASQYP
jgi:transcription antitermination factor NusG